MAEVENKLKRTLKLPRVVLYGTGTILGAGIYALIGKIVGAAGVFAPISFVFSAFLASLTAYSYSQLVKKYPASGSEAEYVYQGFKKLWLSYLVGWLVSIVGMVSAATLVTGFVGYFQAFLPFRDEIIIFVVILVIVAIAVVGINQSAWVASIATIIEISGLVLVSSVAFPSLVEQNFLVFQMTSEISFANLAFVLSGAFLAFYAFIGFEDMVNLAEETHKPEQVIPRAIFISLAISLILYVIVSMAAIAAMPIEELKNSKAPLADMYKSYGGNAKIISVIGMVAVINGTLAQVIMASRILYGIRHKHKVLKLFKRVYSKTRTPIISTLFVMVMVLLFSLAFDVQTLAETTSASILLVFSIVNLTLLYIEIKKEKRKALNIYIPSLAIILNFSLVAFKILS